VNQTFFDHELEAFLGQLHATGWLLPEDTIQVLSGGVSAVTVLVKGSSRSFVAKTARQRLVVNADWQGDRGRVFLEAEILRYLAGQLGPLQTPLLLGVSANPPSIALQAFLPLPLTWKEAMIAGNLHPEVVDAAATGMAVMHAMPLPHAAAFASGGLNLRQLRIEPFYLRTAERVPHYSAALRELARDLASPAKQYLAHGDFTPKNILLTARGPALVDFETAHAGQPALDVAMLTAHLMLKAVLHGHRHPEFASAPGRVVAVYRSSGGIADESLCARHAGAVVLARMHGFSTVDYLVAPKSRCLADQLGAALLSGDLPLVEFDSWLEQHGRAQAGMPTGRES
jgi:5-methylthioribose kinase